MEFEQTINKFMSQELPTHNIELGKTQIELITLYQKLQKIGVFDFITDVQNLDEILTQLAKFDASIALSVLSNQYAHNLVQFSDQKIEYQNLVAPIYQHSGQLGNHGDIIFSCIPGFSEKLILPIQQGNVQIRMYDIADVKEVKTIGSFNFPIFRLSQENNYISLNTNLSASELENIQTRFLFLNTSIQISLLEKSFQYAKEYSTQRIQGQKLLKDWSLIQMNLNRLEIQLENLLSAQQYNLDHIATNPHKIYALAIEVKSISSEFINNTMQVLGGFSYMKEYPLEKIYRDNKHLIQVFGNKNYLTINYEKYRR